MAVKKGRENQVSVDVGPRIRAAMDAAKQRSQGDPLSEPLKDSDIVRDALRNWVSDSPYAMNAAEMWLLRASRKMRSADAALWERTLRGLAGRVADISGDQKLEGSLDEFLSEISREEDRAKHAPDRREVRTPGKRKAS